MMTPAIAEEKASQEIDIVLLAVRCHSNPRRASELRQALNGEIDWAVLIQEAGRHRLIALLYASLKKYQLLDIIPRNARRTLEEAVRTETSRSLMLTGELVRILRALQGEGVPALPFKGPVLSLAAYGDFALRSCCDLDILVNQEELGRARQVLEKFGYTPLLSMNAQQERAYLKTECALQMVDDARGYLVELHWRFSERHTALSLPLDEFWNRAGRIAIADIHTRTLAPEDLVIYLCFHGAKHCWERAEWVCCLSELIRSTPDLDWTGLLFRADTYRVGRLVHLGLMLTQLLMDTSLPADVVLRLRADREAASLAKWVCDTIYTPAADSTHYEHQATRYVFMVRAREHWADRLRIVLFSTIRTPHPDAPEWLDLPPRLSFLHSLLRPIRLFGEYGAVAWRRYVR